MFGGHLTVGNIANFASSNMDSLLIGKFVGADALGLYAKAYQLFLLPIKQLREPLQNVALPALSTLIYKPEQYKSYYRHFLSIIASLTIPISVYCYFEADFLIRLLLGQKWLGAIPVFRILAIAAFIHPLAGTQGLILVSTGKSRRFLVWQLSYSILSITAFAVGLPFGIRGVAIAFTIMNYAFLLPSLYFCFIGTPVSTKQFLGTLVAPTVMASISALVMLLFRSAMDKNSVVVHCLMLAFFIVIYSGLSYSRRSIRADIHIALTNFPIRFKKISA
jgi:PST family polysaccharide transporter